MRQSPLAFLDLSPALQMPVPAQPRSPPSSRSTLLPLIQSPLFSQAGALQRIQVARAFDVFQMLDVLQDLRGAVAQQVSLLFCPSPLWCSLFVGRCPITDSLEMQMCHLATPADSECLFVYMLSCPLDSDPLSTRCVVFISAAPTGPVFRSKYQRMADRHLHFEDIS